MSVVSTSIPNLVNGISQQNPTQRNITQAEAQVNAQSSIVKGLTKRPPLEFIANISANQAYSTNTAVHPFIRDGNNQYLITVYNGGIKVFNLSGTEQNTTVSSGSSYLASTNPKEDFKFVSVGDYTFILNKSIKPAMAATTTAAKVNEALVTFKNANYGRTYSVTLTHPNMNSGNPVTSSFTMPPGDNVATQGGLRDTAKIATAVRTHSGGSPGTTGGTALNAAPISTYFTVTQYDSVLHIKPTDNNANFTITTADGAGDTAMYAVRDEINDFTKLPYYAPIGTIIKITGDEGETDAEYYVAFQGNGVWSETIGPGIKTSIDASTMPHAVVRDATTGNFTYAPLTWTNRASGDDETNPEPTFIGKTVNNISFYKNRLILLADENIVFSEAGAYYNFFSTSVAAQLDTDPIDLAASSNEVSILKHVIPYNEELLLFSDRAQFKVEAPETGYTPSGTGITLSTRFQHDPKVEPVGAGNYIYFAQAKGTNTAIQEYFVEPDTSNNDAADITVGVPSLIPQNCYKLISNTIEDTILALVDDGLDSNLAPYTASSNVAPTFANRIYVYKYFWNANEKVQSAWSYWDFAGIQIISAITYESSIYILANERQNCKLYKLDLRNLEDSTLGINVYLDQRVKLSGSYNAGTGLTTFTMPYTVNTGLQCIDAATGANVEINTQSGTTVTVQGNIASAYLGFNFQTLYTLSTQYLREPGKTGGLTALTSGRLQVRTMSFDYVNTGFFQAVVSHNNRTDQTYSFNGYIIDNSTSIIGNPVITTGTFRIPIQAQNTQHSVTLKTSSYLPANIVGAEMEGFYYRRSQRA